MFNANAMFSSNRMNWKTPKKVYEKLDKIFKFDFDPCPPNPQFDGLAVNWKQVNYVNPPYSREIGLWVKKSFEESQKGKIVVMLIPSRTGTKWWHNYVMKATEIWFVQGRLRFDDLKNSSAPFPSAIIIFDKNINSNKYPIIKAINFLDEE